MNNNNNNGHHLEAQDNAKKAKLDEGGVVGGGVEPEATRVVHLRNVVAQVTDSDVIQLGLPFGKISNILSIMYSQDINSSLISLFRLN